MKFNLQLNNIWIFVLLGVGLLIFLLVMYFKHFKRLKIPNVYLVTGAVKTGKTGLSVYLAIKTYYGNLIKWYIGKVLYWLIHHNLDNYPKNKPMLYSNIPLACKHNKLTYDILLRKVRIPNKSVVLIDEASLLIDSMTFKNKHINDTLTLFLKLFGHYSHGGTIICNSQCISDLHYSFKRVSGRYFYIYQSNRLPFVSIIQGREMCYSDDTSMVNDVNEDFEVSQRRILVFNLFYKLYDCYCYSIFTDNKMFEVDYNYKYDKHDLKAKEIISLNSAFSRLSADEEKQDA